MDFESRIVVYCQATGHDEQTARDRIMEIGLHTWETDPYYMPERVCGRVRPVIHGVRDAS